MTVPNAAAGLHGEKRECILIKKSYIETDPEYKITDTERLVFISFHAERKEPTMKNYFCGWYLKCQSDHQTLALIAAFHEIVGTKSCSVQLITDEQSFHIPFPIDYFRKSKQGFSVRIGKNSFSREGIKLDIHTDTLTARGCVRFGEPAPLNYDIMGPFCFVPFMECRHSVLSMKHSVNGTIRVNGTDFVFTGANGYIEGDRGTSFPNEYAWTQCLFPEGSLMLSAADIPIGPFHFTGVISIVRWQQKEYRLATYLGAKAVRIKNGELTIRQGPYVLNAKLLEQNAHCLRAPKGGAMERTIREHPSCRAQYTFMDNGRTLFSFISEQASFEYEYPC